MTSQPRILLVTSALPYANGPIHIGHVLEYVQTDVWVRFQHMRGHHCTYVCADDAHGTPIMLKARDAGVSPEELVAGVGEEHRADFRDFLISVDSYHTTHSPENQAFSELIYQRLREGGHIATRTISQAYDAASGIFLPDRYVRGICPTCGAADQYGDSCEVCGRTYTPADLVQPYSVLSGEAPEWRETEHHFVKLGDFEEMLKAWVAGEHGAAPPVQPEIANKLQEWFEAGLRDWDISRDAPYFGFEIPDAPGKYFYVWLDAPIGYMASFKALTDERDDLDFDAYWGPDSRVELYHFIGKDIAYFHTLFWPAMLRGAGFRTPTAVFVHGFLTVNGQKMSKSRGTFINARTYLEHLDPEYLRYYFACKLGPAVDDLDLNLEDFVQRVNSDLVGKVVNIASRCARFIERGHDGLLAPALPAPELMQRFVAAGEAIACYYEGREFGKAVTEIRGLADLANQYIDEHKPWVMAKEPGREAQVQAVCTQGLNMFRALAVYLKPVLPAMVSRAEAFLGVAPLAWSDAAEALLGTRIERFQALLHRVDPARVEAMVAASREELAGEEVGEAAGEPEAPQITLAEFERIDLRVARVTGASLVDGADKLLELELDLGPGGTRNVFAGIRAAYDPAALVGRLVVVVANLQPREMRFGISEGMVLAAGPGAGDIWLLSPDSGAEPGLRVR